MGCGCFVNTVQNITQKKKKNCDFFQISGFLSEKKVFLTRTLAIESKHLSKAKAPSSACGHNSALIFAWLEKDFLIWLIWKCW